MAQVQQQQKILSIKPLIKEFCDKYRAIWRRHQQEKGLKGKPPEVMRDSTKRAFQLFEFFLTKLAEKEPNGRVFIEIVATPQPTPQSSSPPEVEEEEHEDVGEEDYEEEEELEEDEPGFYGKVKPDSVSSSIGITDEDIEVDKSKAYSIHDRISEEEDLTSITEYKSLDDIENTLRSAKEKIKAKNKPSKTSKRDVFDLDE